MTRPAAKDCVHQLGSHVWVHEGAVRTGIVRAGDRALLIDCGDGVADALRRLGVAHVERVLVTHAHRDQLAGLGAPAADGFGPVTDDSTGETTANPPRGPLVIAPAGEADYLRNAAELWLDPKNRWHVYHSRPDHLLPVHNVPVAETISEPDEIAWGPVRIRVLDTPGHTDGSVSYEVIDGDRRFLFTGDVIYAPGQILDVHSLQKGGQMARRKLMDYHGFMGARRTLQASLEKLKAAGADMLVPSHGDIMTEPVAAIAALQANLEAAYADYAAVSALNFYFPDVFDDIKDRVTPMPQAATSAVPDFLRHVGTTWILLSESGAAFVMDCGGRFVLEALARMQTAGELTTVEGFWISHYHDDHVDGIADFQATYACPTWADAIVAAVVAEPRRHRLPCISPVVARVDHRTAHGQSWTWREFRLTAYTFPGQTLYHGALLVEGRGRRLFFIGDSFTPGGLDDYCAGNRNHLGAGVGLDACLELVDELKPDAMFNCHVDVGFAFSSEQIAFMRRNLAERRERFARLLPWEDPNFGIDPYWLRADPYEQTVRPGERFVVELRITNHAVEPRAVRAQVRAPAGWRAVTATGVTGVTGGADSAETTVPGGAEGTLRLGLAAPEDARPGLHVIPIAVVFGGRALGPIVETMIWVDAQP